MQIVMVHSGYQMMQRVRAEICERQEDRVVDHLAIAHRIQLK